MHNNTCRLTNIIIFTFLVMPSLANAQAVNAARHGYHKQSYTVIKTEELRKILDNAIISWDDDDGNDPYKFKEIFYPDGKYGKVIRQPRLGKWMGRFEIENDHYCAIFIDERTCFQILRSGNNELYRQLVGIDYSSNKIKIKIRKAK